MTTQREFHVLGRKAGKSVTSDTNLSSEKRSQPVLCFCTFNVIIKQCFEGEFLLLKISPESIVVLSSSNS